MEVVSMHQAKGSLSQLVKRAAAGETILIGAYGQAEAALVPPAAVRPVKIIGILAGKLTVPEDFDAPLPADVLAGFEE
ncbi:MAG: type II toxin-antitoxin system prevent-host-death family antitoxin [Azospirillaceae bacterium]|nr:type II toxin-antitoxin system prevent-host-death family antitoxin [Azospirillaceae bacterium]